MHANISNIAHPYMIKIGNLSILLSKQLTIFDIYLPPFIWINGGIK